MSWDKGRGLACLGWALVSAALALPVRATEGRPHLFLVTVDTLRADYLSTYGYPYDTSPTVDQLAQRGTLFEDVITTIGKTGPAMASLFTSTFPPTHGARRNGVPIRSDIPTLAEMLRDEGYTTAAFITNWTLRHRLSGLARGFEHYDETFNKERNSFGAVERDAASVTRAVLDWLKDHRSQDSARPLFLWVHYSDPHSPYDLQAAYAPPKPAKKPGGWSKRWKYSSEVRYTDRWIGRLLKYSAPYLPRASTYLVFSSDHGESLGEHGFWGHGKNVHWPNLKIPLVVVGPGVAAGVRDPRPASIIDLVPTLFPLLGLEPPEGLAGKDLLARRPDSESERIRYAFASRMTAITKKSRQRYENPLMLSLQTTRVKTVWDFSRRTLRYFDLAEDPHEERALDQPPVDTRPPLRRLLVNWYRELPKYEALSGGELSPEDIEQLRSLGYLGR